MTSRMLAVMGLICVAAAVAPQAEPLRLLILTGQHNHDWQSTTPALKTMYETSGRFAVDVTEAPSACDATTLAKYDVVVDNWAAYPEMTGHQWGPVMEQALLDYVSNGGGFVLLHAATACFADWPEFDQLAGCAWRDTAGHGAVHRFKIVCVDKEHPITAGMPDFVGAPDELYHRLTPQPTMHVLCTAFSDKERRGTGQAEPVAVCTQYGKGRCFYNILGHDVAAMENAGFRALMLRGTEWAATGEVTLPWPDPIALAVDGARDYTFGQSRQGLLLLEDRVREALNVPAQRAHVEEALDAVLSSDATRDCKEFVCKQLSLIGTERSVPALAARLTDPELGDMARYALERIPGPSVDAALRNALEQSAGRSRIGILNTLGDRYDAGSVETIAKYVGDPDPAVAMAAMGALGKIGGDVALATLEGAPYPADSALHRAAVEAMLACADRLLAEKKDDAAAAVYDRIYGGEADLVLRTAAFRGLVAARSDDAAALLAKTLASSPANMTPIALRLARQTPGASVTTALAATLPSLSPDVKELLVKALGDRGDAAAREAVAVAAQDGELSVRLAAFEALGRLGDASTVPLLAAAVAGDGPERDAARDALTRLAGPGINEAILADMAAASPAARAVLIQSLAARNATVAVPALLDVARDDDDAAVRKEALAALGVLCGAPDVPALTALLLEPASDADLAEVENAVVDAVRRTASVAAVLAVYPKASATPARCSVLRVLGEAGDNGALDILRAAVQDAVPEVRDAAVRALAAWPSVEPLGDLLDLARSAPETTLRVLALRGAVRLLGLSSNRPAEETILLYQQAMAACAGADEKKLVLGGLAGVADPRALDIVEASLDDPELYTEAATATLKIAEAIAETHPAEAEACLKRLADTSPDETVAAQARGLLAKTKLKRLDAQNLARNGVAASPDDLDSDGGATGDQAAIDGNPETYWDEVDGKDLYVLEVSFSEPKEVSLLSILGYNHQNYAPKDFEVLCDGQPVATVKDAQYTDNLLLVDFPRTACKTVQLRITGYYGQSPAIRELGLYDLPPEGQP